MKFGFRTPSVKRRISARLSWKRYARHSLGLKAPRGWGWITNPKKAAYNRIYRRTTFGLEDLFKGGARTAGSRSAGRLIWILVLVLLAYFLLRE